MIRLLIVDAERYARSGLRAMLEGQAELAVVGEAASGSEALSLARTERPDVVLLEIALPGRDAFAVTRALAAAERPIPVVVITATDSDERLFGAIDAGAVGLLRKNAAPAEIARAIRAAAAGHAAVASELTPRLLHEFARRRPISRPATPHTLSDREVDVVRALVTGEGTNTDIAERLGLTSGSVKGHLGRILPKLGLRTRTQLGVWAVRGGIEA
ncbi:response regulator transcription factor [Leucobacter sp. CSA2]|uniref:Response regulator transcription factor n=1 Tax=Leucobacter edaphi TaxID=2796472 RepID=A0A934QDP6_9MICO|nr:response regulator transcription factor [Leucobacter edaphi]MBK0421329.1 response regulator transcription factor [Leucobacter edaphi]